jgi:hypothetical protein
MENDGDGNDGGQRQPLISPEMGREISLLITRAFDERDRQRQRHRRSNTLESQNGNNGGNGGNNGNENGN